MKLWERKVSRRKLLALGGASIASGWLASGLAQARPEPQTIRIGIILPSTPVTTPGQAANIPFVAQAAHFGSLMAQDELGANAALVGQQLDVRIIAAVDAQTAVQAAERLIATEEVFAFAGGYDESTALALSKLADNRQVPFFNIGSASDALRVTPYNRTTFHVEASETMYIEALAASHVRSQLCNWFYVYHDTDTGRAGYARTSRHVNERHFSIKNAGSAAVDPAVQDYSAVLEKIQSTKADFVFLLTDPASQLHFLAEYEKAGLPAVVTGFPYPGTQTRAFLAAARDAAPKAGMGFRASLWDAKIGAYGARELNQRYYNRWGTLMDGPAWAAYQTVKMLYEAAMFGGALDAKTLISYFENPDHLELCKGVGVSFRPWDHQLRQSLYIIKINADARDLFDLVHVAGELPTLYLSGADPLTCLDRELHINSSWYG